MIGTFSDFFTLHREIDGNFQTLWPSDGPIVGPSLKPFFNHGFHGWARIQTVQTTENTETGSLSVDSRRSDPNSSV
jgi:hypothetical protein